MQATGRPLETKALPGAGASALAARWSEPGFTAVLILVWLAATAWMRPLALPDEGRYVGVAWEMLRSGDWLTPTINGLPFFHKPPLFYWITGASLSLFGLNEWAARAAPLLGAWLGAFSLYLFLRRWSGQRAAALSLLALLAQPLFYVGGQFANLDMLVAGCITATVLLLAHSALGIEQGLPFQRPLLAAYAMAAAGVLAKGLIGAVIPSLVLMLWLALLGRWRVLLKLLSLRGFVLFLALTAPWFIAMQSRFPDFLDYFFVVQHFKRFAASGFNNVQPFWFYPAVLALFSLPCLPWLLGLTRRAARAGAGSMRLLMGSWLFAVVLFFSLPQSKLLGYVLPAMAPLAFLLADGFLSLGRDTQRNRRLWAASLALCALVGVGAVFWFTWVPRASARDFALAMAAQDGQQQPVYMLHDYYYDLPFYTDRKRPVGAVEDWSNPELLKSDNGRKELIDAGRFDPLRSASLLISPEQFLKSLCAAPVNWVMARSDITERYPLLLQARSVLTQDEVTLWRLDTGAAGVARSLGCAQAADAAAAPQR